MEKFREDIEWFAKYNSAFTSKEHVQKTNKTFLTEAGVKTISFKKAIKYYYLQGEIADITISATIPIKGGVVNYQIGQYTYCSYNLNTGESNIPKKYWQVEQSIINWLRTKEI